MAGFRCVHALDIESPAAETFRLNFPNVPFTRRDIRHLKRADVERWSEGGVDLVAGGPPCQGFSTIGDQIQGDPRNSLFEAYLRVVRWLRPKCVLVENVNYVLTQYDGRYVKDMLKGLGALGYITKHAVLNAADFGVPQIRKRFFLCGSRISAPLLWPQPTHAAEGSLWLPPYETVGTAIMDLANAKPQDGPPNHIPLDHGETVVARYRLIPEGGRMPPPQELPPEIRRRNFGNTYKRLHRNRPSLTLVPGNNAFPVHPTLHRSLTPREAARLQTFPDSYVFAGSRAEQCRLVGNAVPVRLAWRLGESVNRHLNTDCQLVSHPQPATARLNGKATPLADRAKSSLTAVSMFTGVGGLLLGFQRAGFRATASFDMKKSVAANLALNFPGVPHHQVDLAALSDKAICDLADGTTPDVVFGGPPCQGFSLFGRRRFVNTGSADVLSDPRNELTIKYISVATKFRPKVIFMENVLGLISMPRGGQSYIHAITAKLKRAGYDVSHSVIRCADYGVPQIRQRLILVATLPTIKFVWPEPKYHAHPKSWQRPWPTVADAISDLDDPELYTADFSHVPMDHKPLVVERYKLIAPGGRLPEKDLPTSLRKGYRSKNVKNYSHVYRRLAPDKPATAMVPGHNAFPIHPFLPRALTVREAARIQTFPDTMKFIGTRQQQCTLVGNAVPPLLAETFAQAIRKAILGNTVDPGYKADIYELRGRNGHTRHAGVFHSDTNRK